MAASTCGAAAFDAAVSADLAVSTAVPAAEVSELITPLALGEEVLVVEVVPSDVVPEIDEGR